MSPTKRRSRRAAPARVAPLRSPYVVIGLGIVGGSFARAVRQTFPDVELFGTDLDPITREAAEASGLFTRVGATSGDELERAGLVIVCTPIGAVADVFSSLRERVARDTLVTDVAGVKEPVERAARENLGGVPFIGGHPMAGGDSGGFAAGRADVFAGMPVALCPPADIPSAPGLKELGNLWSALGAKPLTLTARTHDAIAAHTSHLPYLTALALVTVVDRHPEAVQLVGRGLRDATRMAGFAPEVMAEVAARSPALPNAARALAKELERLATILETDGRNLRTYAVRARELRAKLRT